MVICLIDDKALDYCMLYIHSQRSNLLFCELLTHIHLQVLILVWLVEVKLNAVHYEKTLSPRPSKCIDRVRFLTATLEKAY